MIISGYIGFCNIWGLQRDFVAILWGLRWEWKLKRKMETGGLLGHTGFRGLRYRV